jgi:hypothetical protein
MARPRASEQRRRESAFRDALVARAGDVELAKADARISDRLVVRLMNRDDYLAFVGALRAGRVGPVGVVVGGDLAKVA